MVAKSRMTDLIPKSSGASALLDSPLPPGTTLQEALAKSSTPSVQIPLEDLLDFPAQPPQRHSEQDLADLQKSVDSVGFLEDALVRPHPDQAGKYYLMAGHGRREVARRRGDTTLRCKVFQVDDETAFEIFLANNAKRKGQTELQEMQTVLGYLEMKLKLPKSELPALICYASDVKLGRVPHNVVRDGQVERLDAVYPLISSISLETFRVHRLTWLHMPDDIIAAVQQGGLGDSHAKAIARLKDQDQRKALLQSAIAENLSVREIERRVKELSAQSKKEESATPANTVGTAESVPDRLKTAYDQIKRSKVWEDPKKKQKLEKLLAQLEALVSAD